MNKLKNLVKIVVSIMVTIAMVISIIPETNVLALEDGNTSAQTEAQLIEIINRLGEENIIFENAIGIEIGQEVDITNILANDKEDPMSNVDFTLASNNENILAAIDNKRIIGVNEGTTFLIIQTADKYHVLEVYVGYPIDTTSTAVSNTENKNVALMDSEYVGNDFLEVASGLKDLNPRNVVYSTSLGKNEGLGVLTNLVSSNALSYKVQALATTSSRSQYVVYVDAGHGGTDPGAVANGIKEKDINLSVALKVRDKLKALGIQVVMNRQTDVFVNFKDTAAHANSVNPDAFVSIHNNSATAAANGIETFYTKNIDVPLANEVQSRLVSYTGAYNRGVKWDEFYVTNHTTMPAILTEGGFVTNVAEAAKLKTDSYQNSLANAITDGVMKYLKDNVILSSIPSERIYGATRYETSYKVFEKGWNNSETVVFVSGKDYPDALCSAPLAGKYNAPILLVRNESLSQQTELRNLLVSKGVKNIFIIGGTGVIPKGIESELSSMGINYKRLGGNDRFETSKLIANEVGNTTGEIVIVSGRAFADGISISAIAARKGMPILLSEANSVPTSIQQYLKSTNITTTYVVGGTGVLTPGLVNTFKSPLRLGGIDRYETNKQVFERFRSELNLSEVYMASATGFPDALSSSAIAAINSNFVILSDTTTARTAVKDVINSNKSSIKKVIVLGSNKLITDTVLDQLGISR